MESLVDLAFNISIGILIGFVLFEAFSYARKKFNKN